MFYSLRGTALQAASRATAGLSNPSASEYALMVRRCLGPGAEGWLQQVAGMLPAMGVYMFLYMATVGRTRPVTAIP